VKICLESLGQKELQKWAACVRPKKWHGPRSEFWQSGAQCSHDRLARPVPFVRKHEPANCASICPRLCVLLQSAPFERARPKCSQATN